MRQIGTVPDPQAARTFADYLTSLKIEARLDHQAQGWALWVFDEDRVKQAKTELEQFLLNPNDPRFSARPTPAAAEATTPEESSREEGDQPALDLSLTRRLLTVTLALVCIAIYISISFSEPSAGFAQVLQIAPDGDATLAHVRHGELWRLVSPILVHFNFLHVLFNVLMFLDLGRQVELRRGPVRFLLLVLLIAVVSNVAQFYLGDAGWSFTTGFTMAPSGKFGGLSGVLYGLFGYIWVKARREPDLGFVLTPATTAIMVAWLFVCLFVPAEVIGSGIANVTHVVGLFMGLLLGYASYVLRAVRQR
jgi:GlpG protein